MALVERSYRPFWSELPADSFIAAHCSSSAVQRGYLRTKQWLDGALSAALLLVSWPLLVALLIAVKLSSRGPAIYCQRRVGLGGRIFVMYKLRSMRTEAEKESGPRWATLGNDPRITWLGHWLRRLHLDELPQLINVIRGEMSLVGPRPERPEFVSVLAQQIPGYLDRLQVLPGITGLAQVNLPPDSDLESVKRKLMLDLEYIRTASFHLDLRLIICTVLRVMGIRRSATVTWLGLKHTMCLDGTGLAVPSSRPMTPCMLSERDNAPGRFAPVAAPVLASERDRASGPGLPEEEYAALRS